ncbi:MAG: hypothetical protein ACRD4O_11085 [Bryobacteraceae bacterium]
MSKKQVAQMISKFLGHGLNGLYWTCIFFVFAIRALWAYQSGSDVVDCRDPARINDAVLISNVAVAGKTVECGLFIKPPDVVQPVTPFQAGSDWLQQMTISLINRTDKTIVFGEININFLDTGDCKSLPCAGVQLRFGQRPTIDAYDGRTGKPRKPEHPERPPLDWKSEQTIVIHVSDYMAEIEKDLANFMPVTDVTEVKVYRGVFYFSDGMEWSLGRFSVPDPAHLGKFDRLPYSYFPGKRAHNWPPGYNR